MIIKIRGGKKAETNRKTGNFRKIVTATFLTAHISLIAHWNHIFRQFHTKNFKKLNVQGQRCDSWTDMIICYENEVKIDFQSLQRLIKKANQCQ